MDKKRLDQSFLYEYLANNDPSLIANLYKQYISLVEISYDLETNLNRLVDIHDNIDKNAKKYYDKLDDIEKHILGVLCSGFTWLSIPNIKGYKKVLAYLLKLQIEDIDRALASLSQKGIILFLSRVKYSDILIFYYDFWQAFAPFLEKDGYFFDGDPNILKEMANKKDSISVENHIGLFYELLSYICTYFPRSSEQNEIHRVDMNILEFFFSDKVSIYSVDVAEQAQLMSYYGFFQKGKNRIRVDKGIVEALQKETVESLLNFLFLYPILTFCENNLNYFLTLKLLFLKEKGICLRNLFYHHINHYLFFHEKIHTVYVKNLLKQQELRFSIFIKKLEASQIVTINHKVAGHLSIKEDYIIVNEPYLSLFKQKDFSLNFQEKSCSFSQTKVLFPLNVDLSLLNKASFFCEPIGVKDNIVFNVTKKSLCRAFLLGFSILDIKDFFAQYSDQEIPDKLSNLLDQVGRLQKEDITYKIVQFQAQEKDFIVDMHNMVEVGPHIYMVFGQEKIDKLLIDIKENNISYQILENWLGTTQESKQNLEHHKKILTSLMDSFYFYGDIKDFNITRVFSYDGLSQ